ncbi:MAG: glutamine amidotransferase, partial [Pseudomonadota bacterium]
GCCYGMGILTQQLGGEVSKDRYGEPVSPVTCDVTDDGAEDPLLTGMPRRFDAFVGHKEAAQAVAPGATHLMSSTPCPVQMIRAGQNVYATQFHPEADGEVFAERIRIYRNRGYFAPEDADALTAACRAANVTYPVEIFRRFIARYG